MPEKKESARRPQITIQPETWLYELIKKEAIAQDRSLKYIVEEKLEEIYKDKAGK